MRGFAAQRLGNQLPEMLAGKWRQDYLRYLSPGGLDCLDLSDKGMGRSNLVVAIGADQDKVLQVRPGQDILQEIKRSRVKPLQIVQEKCQWVLRSSEDADEPPKH